MQKGFYDLTSGMLTQSRVLNNVSNNLSNLRTAGYKRDMLMTSTFGERMQSRTGNRDKNSRTELAEAAMLRTVDETYTVFEQGAIGETGRSLDFAISGGAFFRIRGFDGNEYYTRNGSFTLDGNGDLILQNVGFVLDGNGGHISLKTDKVTADSSGSIRRDSDNQLAGTIGLVTFTDTDRLVKSGEGMFTGSDAGNVAADGNPELKQGALEASNVSLIDAMTSMMASERAFQSASQVLKMYDQVLSQTVTDVGSLT